MKYLLSFSLFMILLIPAPLRAQEGVFADYSEMRETMDRLMMSRQIVDVMKAFGASDEMTAEELSSLQSRVRAIYPKDFEHAHLLKSDDMGQGWKQELYAYWVGHGYIYTTVLFHQREDSFVAIQFKFNTDFDKLIVNF